MYGDTDLPETSAGRDTSAESALARVQSVGRRVPAQF